MKAVRAVFLSLVALIGLSSYAQVTNPATINGASGPFTFSGPGVSQTGSTFTFSGSGSGVTSINGNGGVFTFTGSGVNCVGTTCTFAGGGGSGTVTSFSAGNLSPLFTTAVGTATTTPALTFTLSNAAANTVFGNFTGSSAQPTFSPAPVFSAANLTNFPTFNQNTTGTAAGFTGSLSGDVTGTQSATVVGKINGVALSGLGTGLLKNTTGTGVPSIAIAGTDYLTPTGSATGLSKASAAAFGVAECDNTTITCAGGVFTAVTGGSGVTALSATPSAYLTANSPTGAVTLTAKTQRGKNAVVDLGLDNTGASDIGATLNTYLATYSTSSTMPEIWFPAGSYLVTTQIKLNGTSTTGNNLVLIAEGRAAQAGLGVVTFNCNVSGGDCLWVDNATATTANQRGPRIEGITFNDTSTGHDDHSLLRITQYNNIELPGVSVQNSTGDTYSTGTVTVTNGSTSVTGSGTSWTSAMAGGFLWVAGNFQEIASVGSSTTLTLTSNWQYPSGSGSAHVIGYNGIGLLLEGTSATGFTQYGVVSGFMGFNLRVCVDAAGGPTSSSGVSRIHFDGGYCNGNRVADSVGLFAGKFSDTLKWDLAVNNVTRGVAIESGHAHRIEGELENTGAFAIVSTCNGGVAAQSCTHGVNIVADATTTGHDNIIQAADIQNWGNAIQFDSANVTTSVVANNALRSNLNNYVWSDASTGCSATQINANVFEPDCTFLQTDLPVGAGGTGVSTAAANTAFGNFTGSTAAPSFGKITLASLATQAADTILGNFTGSAASPTAVTLPSCSGASNALTYNTTTHAIGCNTISITTATNIAGGALGSVPYQSSANNTTFLASPTTSGHTFVLAWQPSGSAIAPTALDLATFLASPPAIGGTTPAAGNFSAVSVGSSPPTACGSATGCLAFNEASTAGTPTASQAYIRADSTTNTFRFSVNGGSEASLPATIASGSTALHTAAIAAGACDDTTATATGATNANKITWNANADLHTVTGYIPSTSGGLGIQPFITANTMNINVCNWTGSSITPGAVTIVWSVQ